MMKRIILGAGLAVVLLLGAAAIIPFLVPESVYKTQIEKAASSALQRDVMVNGGLSISVFPAISASVENVTVANPEGFPDDNMIEAGALRGSVRLWPLLSRRVEVNKIEFVDANVNLTRLVDGRVNWELGSETEDEPGTEKSGGGLDTSVEKFSLQNASLNYTDLQAGTGYTLTDLNIETAFKSIEDPLSVKADGVFQGQAFTTRLDLSTPSQFMEAVPATVEFEFQSDLGRSSFSGTLQASDAIAVDGTFSASAPQLSAVADFLNLQLPLNLAPLGALQLNGLVSGTVPSLKITFDTLTLNADGFSASYKGSVDMADLLAFNGTANISARNVYQLARDLGFEQAALAPIQQLTYSSSVAGPIENISLNNVDLKMTSPSLQASYAGALSTGGAGKLDGNFSVQSDQFRSVLSQLGVILPEGETLKSVKLGGNANGTFQSISVSNGSYQIDDIKATGLLGINLAGAKPRISADLDTDTLDFAPFLGEPAPQQQASTQGWSDAPLDLESLKSVDADIKLRAKSIKIGAITLTDSEVESKLTDGKLLADLKSFKTFNGAWTGKVGVNASKSVPDYSFQLSAADVSAQSMLTTLAQFGRLSGDGAFAIDVTSTGSSLSQIVNRLSGKASLNLDEGSLAGVNLGQLVRSANSLTSQAASGQLTLASLGEVVSAEASTDFTNFETELNIAEGIAQISSMKLANSVVDVSGTGQLNLGGRSLDVKLTPAVDRRGQGQASTVQLNGIPIPLRVSGSWVSPKFTPDFSQVTSSLSASVRQRAVDTVASNVDGELGSIVSGVLGTRQQPQTTPTTNSQEAGTTQKEEEEAKEDDTDTVIRNALGGLLKRD